MSKFSNYLRKLIKVENPLLQFHAMQELKGHQSTKP